VDGQSIKDEAEAEDGEDVKEEEVNKEEVKEDVKEEVEEEVKEDAMEELFLTHVLHTQSTCVI
jgi:hypothetical protein